MSLRQRATEKHASNATKADRVEFHMKAVKSKKLKDAPEQQSARFIEAAKNSEADERPEALDRAFGKLDVRNKAVSKKK